MNQYLYSEFTTFEINEVIRKEDPIVILPVGSMEQHGPHLPLNTDADLGFNVALELAKNAKKKVLVLPAIWAGYSPHHMDFHGTITLKSRTLKYIVEDIIESLLSHYITKIVLLNSHGGNTSLLKTVTDDIHIKYKEVSILYFTYWHLISQRISKIRKSKLNGMAHACELETSLMYYFNKRVKKELIKDVMLPLNGFQDVDMYANNRINVYKNFKDLSETGQIGAPSLASYETGEQIINALVTEFNKLIEYFWD